VSCAPKRLQQTAQIHSITPRCNCPRAPVLVVPRSIETHSTIQEFFFGDDLLLRRHDYRVNIAGGFTATQLISDYVEADGIKMPSRRRAHTRGPDGWPVLEMLLLRIDLSDVRFA